MIHIVDDLKQTALGIQGIRLDHPPIHH